MSDIEQRLDRAETFINLILMAHANPHNTYPLNDKESEYVKEMQKRMGWRGYNIMSEKLEMQEVTLKYDNLKQELQILEAEYPSLKGK